MQWHPGTVSEVRRGEWREDHYATLIVWGVWVRAMTGPREGRRFAYVGPHDTGTKAGAEKLVELMFRRLPNDPNWTPIDNPHWEETNPVYGSLEYQRSGEEQTWGGYEREQASPEWEDFRRWDALHDSYMG